MLFVFCSYRWLRAVGCSAPVLAPGGGECVAAQDTADSGAAADITQARLRYISNIYSRAPVHIYYLLSILSTAPVHDDVLTRVRVTTSLSRLQQLQCCTEASEAPSLLLPSGAPCVQVLQETDNLSEKADNRREKVENALYGRILLSTDGSVQYNMILW